MARSADRLERCRNHCSWWIQSVGIKNAICAARDAVDHKVNQYIAEALAEEG